MMKARVICLALVIVSFWTGLVPATPLDDYVNAPDDSYRFEVVRTLPGPGGTVYVVDLKSQSWRTESEVDRTLWQHWLIIVKPDKVAHDTALLWINGGSNRDQVPSRPEERLIKIAAATGSVVADLQMVPNQPLIFADDPGNQRYEDAIIAYTFDKFLRKQDPTWPLLLPMVKSAVRAMDTVTRVIKDVTDGKAAVNKFVVSGGSKRGWTTWLTAAVDKRVVGIAPAVIDVLHMAPQMMHHFAAYGFYSPAIGDYERMKVLDRLDTEGGSDIRNFVDPYEYRDRYAGIPKFGINSPGDQFFVCDSAQFYFHDLPGEKFLRYCPNTDHSLNGSDAVESLLVFYQSILQGSPRPKFTWTVRKNGTIAVTTETEATTVTLWQATNPDSRDFRLEKIGKVWKSSPLSLNRKGLCLARMEPPEKGWTAFFVELQFDSGTPIPYKFTTEVSVVPKTLPFAEKLKERLAGATQ